VGVVTFTLAPTAPTATYSRRLAEWVETHADPLAGALVLRLRKRHGGSEKDVYAVEEQHPPAPGIREWLLLNTTDDQQRDVYKVTLGRVESCTCVAGYVGVTECKHISALKFITGGDMRKRTHRGTEYQLSEAHPAAERFPWLDEDELQELADDIAENGQEVLILRLPDDRIVDGRNRELACRVAGVEPQYREEEMTDAEIIARVKSRNIHRRHLSASQRAMIAAELVTTKPGANQHSGGVSRGTASQQLGVSIPSVARATKVKEEAPELVQLVKDGTLDVKTAAKVAELPEEVRQEIAEADCPKEEAKRRLPINTDIVGPLADGENAKPIVDPDHPHAELLKAIIAFATRISKAVNDSDAESLLRLYLLNIGFVSPRAKIVGDKHFGWQCVGLRGLYRVVRLAGLPGKKRKDTILKVYQDAMKPDGDA